MNNTSYIKILLSPQRYVTGSAVKDLKSELLQLLGPWSSPDVGIFIYGNGRSAQYEFLKSLRLSSNSNIVVQGFTCNAVINPILWLGLEPRYVDIDPETFCLSLEDLEKKTDENTKVIVLQHTFGYPGPIEDVMKFARDREIIVLEDCAHCFGQKYKGQYLGTFGDAAIFSFGIEKVLSSRVGGCLLVNNTEIMQPVADSYKNIPVMSWSTVLLWLINPLIWRSLRKFGSYQMKIAGVLNKFRLLNMGFYKKELTGQMPGYYPAKLANALGEVVLSELDDLKDNISHRRKITRIYTEELSGCRNVKIYAGPGKADKADKVNKADKADKADKHSVACVRFPVVCKTSEKQTGLREVLQDAGFYIGDWYNPVIYPGSTDLKAMKYSKGDCPNAEAISTCILNLPTGMNISAEGAKMIAGIIRSSG